MGAIDAASVFGLPKCDGLGVGLLLIWTGIVLPWFLYWLNLVRTMRRIMPQLPLRAWGLAVGAPVLWLALFVLCIVVIPLAFLYPVIVVKSLN